MTQPLSKAWSIAVYQNTDKHCHVCAYVEKDHGDFFCAHPQSIFNDGLSIDYDGRYCATNCGYFSFSLRHVLEP